MGGLKDCIDKTNNSWQSSNNRKKKKPTQVLTCPKGDSISWVASKGKVKSEGSGYIRTPAALANSAFLTYWGEWEKFHLKS